MTLDKVLNFLGRAFIGAGILVFLFIAYQLWGTNLSEMRNQDKLRQEASSLFKAQESGTGGDTTSPTLPGLPGVDTNQPTVGSIPQMPQNTTPAPPPAPAGAAVAVLKIPKIGVQKAVVEGTDVSDLKKGPGHYIGTPLPGQPGNAAIAGHRTTYGAPFNGIGDLNKGDAVYVTTRQGTFVYRVDNTRIVNPDDVSVLNPTKDNRLTLTSCHPKFSAAKRIVVTALLDMNPAPAAPTTSAPPRTSTTPAPKPGQTTAPTTTTPSTTVAPAAALSDDTDLSGTSTSKTGAIVWGLLVAIIGMVTWVVGQVKNKWIAYIVGTPFFLVALFVFFENFSRLLPANY